MMSSADADVRIAHVRQFYVSRSQDAFRSNWRTVRLTDDAFLHAHPALPMQEFTFGNQLCVVVGEVATSSPLGDRLDQAPINDKITDVYRYWAGRWAVFVGDELHADAAGLLNIYYNTGESEVLLTSSLSLAEEVESGWLSDLPPFAANVGTFYDWVPGNRTAKPDYRRLGANEILHLGPPAIVSDRRPDSLYRVEVDDPIKQFSLELVTLYKRHPAQRFLVPLTGGFDSRTVLAGVHASGKEVRTFTHRYPGMLNSDRDLPARLSALLGVSHDMLVDRPAVPDALRRFDLQSFGQCAQTRRFFEHQHYEQLPSAEEWSMAAGTCWEVGRAYLFPYFPAQLTGDVEADADRLIEAFQMRIRWRPTPAVRQGLVEWLERLASIQEPVMAWQDRFYLEERVGGWLGVTEQATDLNGFGNFHAVNSHRMYGLMLSLPYEARREGTLQRETIAKLAPSLLSLPINPKPKVAEKMLDRTMRLARRAGLSR